MGVACGIGKTAQYSYEKGVRVPSHQYFDALDRVGGDSSFVWSGIRKSVDDVYARAYMRMLYTVEMLLGLQENQIEKISLLCAEKLKSLDSDSAGVMVEFDSYNRAVMDWLKTCTKPDRCMDFDLLCNVIAEFEIVLTQQDVTLTAEKKSRIIIMLYRAFVGGKINRKVIGDAILVAE